MFLFFFFKNTKDTVLTHKHLLSFQDKMRKLHLIECFSFVYIKIIILWLIELILCPSSQGLFILEKTAFVQVPAWYYL